MSSPKEKQIIDSWMQNALPWIDAITNNEIESRKLITNKAIIESVLEKEPQKVLDVGCGEGWLIRELSKKGITGHGIDIIPELVAEATTQGQGSFEILSYEDLAKGILTDKFDVAVCNFSLLGRESVNQVFRAVKGLLNEGGFFIVQTIHPISGCGSADYKDAWRKGSWTGFSNKFTNPAPWYFRTLESWKDLFSQNGIRLREVREPMNPTTNTFASAIFIGDIAKK